MRIISFTHKLRGQEVEVKAEMLPAEPDVGIMSPYPNGFSLYSEENKELDWELTDDEERWLCEIAVEAYYNDSED